MANVGRSLYKLYVANLPWTISSRELKEYFTKFGQVNGAHVVFDQKTGFSRSYGFVVFNSKENADEALNAPEHKLEGSRLRVNIAQKSDE